MDNTATGRPAGDVVVVGGGVIGLAIAWRLASAGAAVTVIDPSPGAAASHAAAGMLAPVSEVRYGETDLLRLGQESLARYPSFVEALTSASGIDPGLRQDGTLLVATDGGDRAQLQELHEFQHRLGLDSELVTSRECRRLEPLLSPAVRSGLHVLGDHSVDNRTLVRALRAAVVSAGVTIVSDHVIEVMVEENRATGVRTAAGDELRADHVVIAAGPWSGRLAGLPEAVVPKVRPVKGQILRLTAPDPSLLPRRSIRGLVNGEEIYLVPRRGGELVVGATVEDMGFDTTVRAGAVHDLLRDARAVFPAVDEFALAESMAALRPGSPDNAPLIGATGVDGLWLATGHHRNGVLLAPITADLVAGLLTGDLPDGDAGLADLVSPQRFAREGVPA